MASDTGAFFDILAPKLRLLSAHDRLLVMAVYRHALDHYSDEGSRWDRIVEIFNPQDIVDYIRYRCDGVPTTTVTPLGAIRMMGRVAREP